MHPYQAEQVARQRMTERRQSSARAAAARQARAARRAGAQHGGRRPIRRRAGWALISLGLRLAYTAGED
jgi:hypothetical protein